MAQTRQLRALRLRTVQWLGLAVGLVVLVVLGLFAVLVAIGYLAPLGWTGFSGNTLWDWVKLLLVPLLIPTVLLPAVVAHLDHRLGENRSRG